MYKVLEALEIDKTTSKEILQRMWGNFRLFRMARKGNEISYRCSSVHTITGEDEQEQLKELRKEIVKRLIRLKRVACSEYGVLEKDVKIYILQEDFTTTNGEDSIEITENDFPRYID